MAPATEADSHFQLRVLGLLIARRAAVMKVAFRLPTCGSAGSSAVIGVVLASVTLADQHLADLPNTALAVRSGLAPRLDRLQRTGAAADFLADAAVGDTFADADEHADLCGREQLGQQLE